MHNQRRSLHEVMTSLYLAEINCGCSSFWDSGFHVWLGDEINGILAETCFWPTSQYNTDMPSFADAGDWLSEQASLHFPKWETVDAA